MKRTLQIVVVAMALFYGFFVFRSFSALLGG